MRDYILIDDDDLEVYKLLINMTNLYIDYRNSLWEGVVNQRTKIIEEEEDQQLIDEMDERIDEVIAFLED